MDDVHSGLSDSEQQEGAYRRAFGDDQKWRGLLALVLEISERCQRYSLSYSDLFAYV
jgi:hypothetical protein